MRSWRRCVKGWRSLVARRERAAVRPPLTDAEGRELPVWELVLSDGETVEYVDAGSGQAILFVPGADGVRETFRYQVPAVSARYRVLCASLRERFAAAAGFDRLVKDLLELMDHAGTGPTVIVGQSLGGAIAMRLAARHPARVRGLVIANSLTRVSYEHVGLNRTLLAPVAMMTTRHLPIALARWFGALWSRLGVWIYDASPGATRVVDYALRSGPRTVPSAVSRFRIERLRGLDLRPELPSIRVPTLVVKGPHDHYTPPAWAEEIAGLIPGARYATIPGTGHCSHISMPGSFNRLILDWLDGWCVDEASDRGDARGGKGRA